MKTPKISLGSWAFSFGPFEDHPWSFSRFIRYAAGAGYDGVEINGFHPHPHPDVYNTADKCAELGREIEALGLGISGYAPDFHSVPPAEVETAAYLREIEKSLAFCNALGIKVLRVDTVGAPAALDEQTYTQRFEQLTRTWRAAAGACKQAGVLLVWEFEPGFWLNKPSEVRALVDAVDHPQFKLLFDTSHAYMGAVVGARQTGQKETLAGGVVEYARMLADQIGHFHLIDSDGSLHHEETSTHTPFGEGRIDFSAVLAAMKPVLEPLEWWCVDFCFCPTTEVDARKAIPYLKTLIASVD